MTEYKLGVRFADEYHYVYNDEDGSIQKFPGKLHWRDIEGGATEIAPDDIWGSFRKKDGPLFYFHNDRVYPDDPEKFLVLVQLLGPTQARVIYFLNGEPVEQAVYKRVTGVGTNWADAFEEDLDGLIYFSNQHLPRRSAWPRIVETFGAS